MPVVPFFDPDTGASGGPTGGGGGPTTPTWLDVPTQLIQMGASATSSITLNTPTNGTGPYFYRVLGYNYNNVDRVLTVSGNVLELSTPAGPTSAGAGASGMGYRVLVWDSAGNFGVGALIIWNDTTVNYTMQVLEERVLESGELPNGYTFAGPRNPPSGWIVGQSRAPTGDGFAYPYPLTSSDMIGNRRANCAPGSFVVLMYQTGGPSSAVQMNLLVLRRKLNMAQLSWGWDKTFDFLDWNNLTTWNPTTPLGTSSTFAGVTEVVAATGSSYLGERVAFASVAGLAPTLETATLTGGVATLETQNTAASTRVAALSFRPGLPNGSQTFREGTLGASIGLLVRMKVAVTLTGNAASADVRIGRDYSPNAGSGIRIAGSTTLIGGATGVRISATRGTTLINIGTFRKSVWGAGSYFGLDFSYFGGQNYVTLYPWNPAWTDYPEWDNESLSVKVDGTIGPVPTSDRPTGLTTNTPYPYGSSFPIDTTGGDLNGFSRNLGIHLGVTQGNATNNGAKVVVENVQYYWKSMNLGVIR